MNKRKPTFYTKSSQAIVFFCILATTIFVSSCSQELFEEQLLKEKITKKKITFEEFSSNKKAVKKFTIAKNELQSASFERAQSNHDLNIVIDTDNIQLIENDDYKSYTIPFIAQGRENKVDNMVIIEKGNYIDVKFISYNLTKQQLSQMNFGTIDNTILLKNNNAIETECNTIVDTAEIYINPATGEISGYVVTYANPCPGTEGNSYVIQQIVSDGSPGGGDGGGSGDFAGGNISGILNFWSNLFGNNYSNGGYGTGEIYTLGGGGLGGSNTSNLGGNTDDNWDSTDVVTNPVITDINFQNAALMLEVSAYLNHIKNQNTVINQFLINNFNANQFIINYVLQNGALTQELKIAINFTLNNIGSIYTTLEQNSNNLTTNELEVLKNNAFNFLLTNANWLANQPSATQQSIYQYLFANNYSQESVAFVENYIIYSTNNPTTSLSQYLNWFSIEDVGKEGITTYSESYWNNPNLTFPQQSLPSYQNLVNNYPNSSINSFQLCTNIGGEILTLYNNIINSGNNINTCAIRLSKALNDCGIIIPNIPGITKAGVSNGSNTKYYFTFAADLNKWMIKTFGTNSNTHLGPLNNNHIRIYFNHLEEYINPINGNVLNQNNPLNGLQGIFSMVSSNSNWSTGHCDILQSNTTCINNCHFEGPIHFIDIWKLN